MPINEYHFEFILLIIALFLIFIVFKSIYERNKNTNKEESFKHTFIFDKNKRLRNEYIKIHGGRKTDAAEILDRQIAVLKRKYPDKDASWLIEKAIRDLKRDRRIT